MGLETALIFYFLSLAALIVFSGASTALEVLSISKLERGDDDDDDDDRFVTRLLSDPVHNGIAMGIARALSVACVVVLSIVVSGKMGIQSRVLVGVGTVASLLVPIFLSKVIAVRGAGKFLVAARPLVVVASYILRPPAVFFGKLVRGTSPGLLELLSFQVVPLRDKLEMFGASNGDDVDEESLIMSSIAEFGETRVREVMVPRIDIVAVNSSIDKEEMLETIIDAGHSRIPVFDESIDRIVGTLYTKDLLRKIHSGEDFSIRELAREAFFVPESKLIDELLTEFKRRKQHLAIVVDEYGGTAGIVTLEDVLEVLVGDIQDEFDTEEALLERIDTDNAVCNAKMHVDEINEVLGLDLPEDAGDSLGGLLYHHIGKVPGVGETWSFGNLVFEVLSVEGQRIHKVAIRGLDSVDRRAEDAG